MKPSVLDNSSFNHLVKHTEHHSFSWFTVPIGSLKYGQGI